MLLMFYLLDHWIESQKTGSYPFQSWSVSMILGGTSNLFSVWPRAAPRPLGSELLHLKIVALSAHSSSTYTETGTIEISMAPEQGWTKLFLLDAPSGSKVSWLRRSVMMDFRKPISICVFFCLFVFPLEPGTYIHPDPKILLKTWESKFFLTSEGAGEWMN